MSDAVYFLLSTGNPAEPLDTTGGTIRFRGTRVQKNCTTTIVVIMDVLYCAVVMVNWLPRLPSSVSLLWCHLMLA